MPAVGIILYQIKQAANLTLIRREITHSRLFISYLYFNVLVTYTSRVETIVLEISQDYGHNDNQFTGLLQ